MTSDIMTVWRLNKSSDKNTKHAFECKSGRKELLFEDRTEGGTSVEVWWRKGK